MNISDSIKVIVSLCLLAMGICFYFYEQNRKATLKNKPEGYYIAHKARVSVRTILGQELAAIDSMGRVMKHAVDAGSLEQEIKQQIIDTAAQWAYITFKKKQFSDKELIETYATFDGAHQKQLVQVHEQQRKMMQMKGGPELLAQAKIILNKAKTAPFEKGPGHHH